MKNLLLALSLFAAFSGAANAFQIQVHCNFNPAHGDCSAENYSNTVIGCRLEARGTTRAGFYLNVFENVVLYPGQNAFVYVNANNAYVDPLISVNGAANCQILR